MSCRPSTRTTLLTFVGLLLTLATCVSQVGTDRSARRSAALDEVAAATAARGFPGVAIAVAPASGPVASSAAGVADRAAGAPMRPDAALHAASTTKAFTAAAVLMLIDRGKLSLEAPVTELLPETVVGTLPHSQAISVHHLLTHTSGLYSPNNDRTYLARYIGAERHQSPFWRPEEIVAFAADPANPPEFEPGQGQQYGDVNYVLLGMIVEAVDGRPFKTFVQEELLHPLGLDSTWFLSDDPARPRARGYTVDSDVIRSVGLDPALAADADGLIDTTDAQEQSDAAAGLITTMPDLARFGRALVVSDLLSEESRRQVLEVADRADEEGALGILRAYRMPYGTIVAAEGDGPGINVVWALHLESETVVAAAVNLFGRWDESEELLQTVVPSALAAVGAIDSAPASAPAETD